MRVEKNIVQDTISITEKIYNDDNRILKRIEKTLYADKVMKIDYSYDSSGKIKRELVKMSEEDPGFLVEYIYQDSLIHQTVATIKNETEIFKGVETFYYDKGGKKIKSIAKQIFVDLVSTDTITNSVTTSIYNEDEFVIETETIHINKPERSTKRLNKYNCFKMVEQKVFNQKDSLIATLEYKYEMDDFKNWIKKTIFKNGEVVNISQRTINYK